MVDFLRHLPRERRLAIERRIRAASAEAARLHALPDAPLGAAVLALARTARSGATGHRLDGYAGYLLAEVIPAIARRLGCDALPDECNDAEVRDAGPDELRRFAGIAWRHSGASRPAGAARPSGDLCPVEFLMREPANGNPYAIALDRACPPGPGADDALAVHLASISALRGHPPTGAWHPGLQAPPAGIEPGADEVPAGPGGP